MKKKYYSKNVFKAVLFAVVCFLFIIWGIFIKKITPGLSDIGPFFIIGGAMFEFIALGQTISELTSHITVFDDGFVFFVSHEKYAKRQKQKIKFSDIRSVSVTTVEDKTNVLLVLLSVLLLHDASTGAGKFSEYTFHMKNGQDLCGYLYNYDEEQEKEFLSILEQNIRDSDS